MTHLGENPLLRAWATFGASTRFYTKQIGVLQEGLFCSPFPSPRCACCTSLLTAVSPRPGSFQRIGTDPGYLSRHAASIRKTRVD